ncbi:EcsC family protein [Schnuerera sp. xch1]|uniref:EcsC family protein n=1 Tax=Schnuerera sp. xch1 TaxID=2874283 RepID=UPI001CBDFC62|nr:EcsC family protein [Schnuerera sp. xch1]MBZ2174254.1 EcsC family protein [Schnuerera sp. xch1]
MNRELKKQLKRINKKERKILNRRENRLLKAKIDPIMDKIQEKIPEKLKSTLEIVFYKGFQLVFERGHAYIEKTYNKDRLQLEHELNNYALDNDISKRNIKKLDKQAKYSKRLNSSISVLEGGVLGILGIGLPDIPFFIAIIMKTIYEVALSYGYNYKSKEEKAYILLLICGAMSNGDRQLKFNERIDKLGSSIDNNDDIAVNLKEKMIITADVLSEAMLTAKFIQGIPILGVVGGVVNYSIIKKIGKYSSLKYKKRYLIKKAKGVF